MTTPCSLRLAVWSAWFWHVVGMAGLPMPHLVAAQVLGEGLAVTATFRPPWTGSPGPTSSGKMTPEPAAIAPLTDTPAGVRESVNVVVAVPDVSPVAVTS